MSNEVARVLWGAAALLESEGWSREWGIGPRPSPCCAGHAIDRAADELSVKDAMSVADEAARALCAYLGLELRQPDWPGFVGIGKWNDAQPSAGPVVAALRAAADEAEAS